MALNGKQISSNCSIPCLIIRSYNRRFSLKLYRCSPSPFTGQGHTYITAGVVGSYSRVCIVLRVGGYSKIAFCVVQSVMVDVVDFSFIILIKAKYLSMHEHMYRLASYSSCGVCIKHGSPPATVFICIPEISHQPFIFGTVHDGVHSTSKRDEPTDFSFYDDSPPCDFGFIFSDMAFYTKSGRCCFDAVALWTFIVAITLFFTLFFGRISSWLGSQLSLVHVSPLREMCGLATLVLL